MRNITGDTARIIEDRGVYVLSVTSSDGEDVLSETYPTHKEAMDEAAMILYERDIGGTR